MRRRRSWALLSLFASFGYNARHMAWAAIPLWVMLAHGVAQGTPRQLAARHGGVAGRGARDGEFQSRLCAVAPKRGYAGGGRGCSTASEPRPTFVLSGYMSEPLAYYLPGEWPVASLPDASPDVDAAACWRCSNRARRCRTGE